MKVRPLFAPAALLAAALLVRPALSAFPDARLLDAASRLPLSDADRYLVAHGYVALGEDRRAEPLLESAAAGSGTLAARAGFNLGNLRFARALETHDPDVRERQAEGAMDAYSRSANLRDDPETRANLEAVEKLLERSRQETASGSARTDTNADLLSETGSAAEGASGTGSSGSVPPVSPPEASGSQSLPADASGSESQREGDVSRAGFTNAGETDSLGRDFGPGSTPLTEEEKWRLEDVESGLKTLQRDRGRFTRPDGTQPPGSGSPEASSDAGAMFGDLGSDGGNGDY